MADPRTETIARTGRGTQSDRPSGGAAAWPDVAALLRSAAGTCWLSVRGRHSGVHTRPLFAAWTGDSFIFCTRSTAAKTARLRDDPDVSLAVDLGPLHLVVEGTASRLTGTEDLERASTAMRDVHGWPTEVVGDELDAPYAAPTSGGPPFQAWELVPGTALAFPTDDAVEPTRFTFG